MPQQSSPQRQPARRLRTVAKPARSSGDGKSSPESRRSRGSGVRTIYEALKRDILEMTIGPGEPLDETKLSERFAMSRTPVREALVRLAAEGLVTTLPNRNTIVTAINFTDLPVYFDALTLMYRVTTRLAALRHREADLAAIHATQAAFSRAVAAADAIGMIAANREFHVAIAVAAGNRYYTEMFARLLDEGRRILRIYYSSFDDHLPREYVDEHDGLIAAIVARDSDLADRLARDHAAQIVRQIQGLLATGIARDIRLDV